MRNILGKKYFGDILKKILIILIIFFSFFSNIYAYNFSEKDEKLLNKIYKIIDKKYSSSIKKRKIYSAIKKLKPKYLVKKTDKKYTKKIRIYYLLDALEKYLEIKLNISHENRNSQKNYISEKNISKNKNLFINSGSNLVNPGKIKKVKNEQDNQEIITNAKKNISKKNIFNNKNNLDSKLEKNNFNKNKINKNILKTVNDNGVIINYVSIKKIEEKKEEKIIENKYLVSEIIDFDKIKINNSVIGITSLGDFECNNEKLKEYFLKELKNKKVGLEALKKNKNGEINAELYLDGKNIGEYLTQNDICKFK